MHVLLFQFYYYFFFYFLMDFYSYHICRPVLRNHQLSLSFFYYSSHLCFWSLWSSAYISLPSMRGYYSNAFLCVKQSNDRTVCSPTSGSNWCLLSHFLTPFCHPVHTSNEILLWSSHLLKYRDCPTINNS